MSSLRTPLAELDDLVTRGRLSGLLRAHCDSWHTKLHDSVMCMIGHIDDSMMDAESSLKANCTLPNSTRGSLQ
jgi:hypothetical protein